MNNDLISRSALQKVFEAECVGECGCCKHIRHNPEGCALIDDAPAVDAEPVRHGSWYYCECSACKGICIQYKPPYCPNCGAKMDAEVNNAR